MHRPMYMTVHQRGTGLFSSVRSPSQTWPVSSTWTFLPRNERCVNSSHRQKTMPPRAMAEIQMLQPLLKKSLIQTPKVFIVASLVGQGKRQKRGFLVGLAASPGERPPANAQEGQHRQKRYYGVDHGHLMGSLFHGLGGGGAALHAQTLQVRHQGVFLGLAFELLGRLGNLFVGVGHAQLAQHLDRKSV